MSELAGLRKKWRGWDERGAEVREVRIVKSRENGCGERGAVLLEV